MGVLTTGDVASPIPFLCRSIECFVLRLAILFITPKKPDWGIGQVQSIVWMPVTVNFTHAGKQMINCEIIKLEKTVPEAAMPDGRSGKED